MAWVERPDGVRLAVQERGEGRAILCAHSYVQHPGVYAGLHDQLARDFRVVTYHARGSGDSTRQGPYDMRTHVADLGAVAQAHGPVEMILANGEAAHWGVHLATGRPDLVPRVMALESVPFRAGHAVAAEALVGSATVLDTLLSMMRADYRTGLRAAVERGNPSLTEDELRRRVDETAAHTSAEAAVRRLEDWIADDATGDSASLGDRLTIAYEGAGAWFPASLHEAARTYLPGANIVRLERGAVSAPELTAALIREVVGAPARAQTAQRDPG